MGWSDAIEESLPSRRDDEPQDLRRDIADELGDHLACAMQRERQQTPDEQTAQQAVLSRFGSPQQIARRLWWDAMQEKIMNQRITLAAAIAAIAACFGVVAFSWMTFNQMSQAAQQTREVNLALMSKLEELAVPQAAEAPASLEWTEVKFDLTLDNGKPAEGFRVELRGQPFDSVREGMMILDETSGSDGIVKFGPIRPGSYSYNIYSPWNHVASGNFIAMPGPQTSRNIRCPGGPSPEGTLRFNLVLSDKVKEYLDENQIEDAWVQCVFERTSARKQLGEQLWRENDEYRIVLAGDRLIEGLQPRLASQTTRISGFIPYRGGRGGSFDPSRVASYLQRESQRTTTIHRDDLTEGTEVTWPTGDYTLTEVALASHKPNQQREGWIDVTLHGIFTASVVEQSAIQSFQLKAGEQNQWGIVKPQLILKLPDDANSNRSRSSRSSKTE